jgi:NitT/TauT family transport system substrate-binding protein
MKTRLAFATAVSVAFTAFTGTAVHAQQTKLTIGSSVQSLFSLPLYIADSKGYFKEAGLDVSVVNFRGGATATPALVGGSVQLQAAGTENLLKLVRQGQPVVAVMTVQSTLNNAVVLRKDIAEKLGRKPTIQDFRDLRVGTLARGGTTDMVIRYMLIKAGMKPEVDVKLFPLGGYDRHFAALQADQVDASVTVAPVQTQMIALGLGVSAFDFLNGEGPDTFQDMEWITLQGKKDYIAQNRDTVAKVVRAIVAAQKFIANPANIDEVVKLAKLQFPNVDDAILKSSIQQQVKTYTPQVTPAGIAKNNDLLIQTGNLSEPVKFEEAVDTSFSKYWK